MSPKHLVAKTNAFRNHFAEGASVSLSTNPTDTMRPLSTSWRTQLSLQRRCFSSTPPRLDNYAFIGLGQMVSRSPLLLATTRISTDHWLTGCYEQGFQMAKNLQAKLSPKDNVSLFDINREIMQKLAGEMEAAQTGGASVALAPSAADASKNAVCVRPLHYSSFLFVPSAEYDEHYCSIYDLSWGQLAGSPVIIQTSKPIL